MEKRPYRRHKGMFVKYHLGLSYVLTPTEARFVMHMIEIHRLAEWGYKTDFTRPQYMKRMGLREHAFDAAARSLCDLGLVVRTEESCRNRVYYALDLGLYERLVAIVTCTQNVDKLVGFLDFNIRKLGRSIDSITDEELDKLVSGE